jgi:hypothetical protein
MTDLRTAALRALEAMEDAHNLLPGMYDKHIVGIKQRHFNAITTLREALAQPIIEPEINVNTWHGLTDEERDYFKACGFVGVSRVEEVLRAKNSTLACIPAVPPG